MSYKMKASDFNLSRLKEHTMIIAGNFSKKAYRVRGIYYGFSETITTPQGSILNF
jgi:hypothetical protein